MSTSSATRRRDRRDDPAHGSAESKTIAWLECDVPTCAAYLTPGFEAATEAIGWDLEIIPMKSTDPGPAFQQAIDAGVDYIASTGLARRSTRRNSTPPTRRGSVC